jgi:hypothetical protein
MFLAYNGDIFTDLGLYLSPEEKISESGGI